jgi:hypothetical protein
MTAAKDLTDDELIARITETYGLRDYGGDVAELVRRYRWREHLVPPAPEKPVATPLRGSTGPLTAADVLELCQRVLDPPALYEDVRTLAEWVLTTGRLDTWRGGV